MPPIPRSIDWRRVPAKTLTLFYPGQSTTSGCAAPNMPARRPSSRRRSLPDLPQRARRRSSATSWSRADKLEPTPPAGKNGVKQLNVQVAYDNENAYFRFQWKTKNPYPGEAYPYYRFDGKEWKPYGAPRLDAGATRASSRRSTKTACR